jgi:hypothetical protein
MPNFGWEDWLGKMRAELRSKESLFGLAQGRRGRLSLDVVIDSKGVFLYILSVLKVQTWRL